MREGLEFWLCEVLTASVKSLVWIQEGMDGVWGTLEIRLIFAVFLVT